MCTIGFFFTSLEHKKIHDLHIYLSVRISLLVSIVFKLFKRFNYLALIVAALAS